MSNRRYNSQTRTKAMGGGMMRKGYMSGGQSKLDVNKDGKITAEDFKMLKSKKQTTKKKKPSMIAMAMKGKK